MMYPQSSRNIANEIKDESNSNFVFEKSDINNSRWIVITEHSATKLILDTLGDKAKKNIMTTAFDNPFIIRDILRSCKIPQTSGYRKINSLIRSGLLVKQGYTTMRDGKEVDKYKSVFSGLMINIEKNSVLIKARISQDPMQNYTGTKIIDFSCGNLFSEADGMCEPDQ